LNSNFGFSIKESVNWLAVDWQVYNGRLYNRKC